MICLRCDGEEFTPHQDHEVEQEFKGELLLVKTPTIACVKCGWHTVRMDQLDELVKRTKEAYRQRLIQKRLMAANDFIQFIATKGRKFFDHRGVISKLESDEQGNLFWVDGWEGRRHKLRGNWNSWVNKIRHGSGLRRFIQALRDFVRRGDPVPEVLFQHWGYGADIAAVQTKGLELGILAEAKQPHE
jgi:hypothetical protein